MAALISKPRLAHIAEAGLALALVIAIAAPATVAYADPPPWAPAHGWRAKHASKGKSKQGTSYAARPAATPYYDYAPSLGIFEGVCSREVIGGLLGAAGGGFVGAQIGKGDGQLVAVGAGVFLGALLGGTIGRSLDQLDQNCIGHALESAPDGQQVAWNSAEGRPLSVTPTSTFRDREGRYCRDYTTEAVIDGGIQQIYGTSCRQPDGTWQLAN